MKALTVRYLWGVCIVLAAAGFSLTHRAHSAAGGESFEGTIQMKGQGEGGSQTINYLVKKDRVRIEFGEKSEDQAIMILDYNRKKIYMVMPDEKGYLEMALESIELGKTERGEVKEKLVKTGKTETISGYRCEQWLLKGEEGEVEICAAKGIGFFLQPQGISAKRAGPRSSWTDQLTAEGLFPFRMVERSPSGEEKSRWEVTKVEKKKLSDSLFQPPAGYEKIQMPEFKIPFEK